MRKLPETPHWVQDFVRRDDGAVTVDYVVILGAVVGLGLAVTGSVASGTIDFSDGISNYLLSVNVSDGSSDSSEQTSTDDSSSDSGTDGESDHSDDSDQSGSGGDTGD